VTLASRTFDASDQQRFAGASGDFNPMHLDPVAARRTQAGAPVVHGVHLLLWTLETLASEGALPPLRGLHAQFDRFVHVDEVVDLALVERDLSSAKLTVSAGGACVTRIDLEFGEPRSVGSETFEADSTPIRASATPRALEFEAMAGQSGRLTFGPP
jgi:acyl dehydratase